MANLKKLPSIPSSDVPFVTAKTLNLLYPELSSLLNSIPSRLEGTERVYNAFIALDMLNALRKPTGDEASKTELED